MLFGIVKGKIIDSYDFLTKLVCKIVDIGRDCLLSCMLGLIKVMFFEGLPYLAFALWKVFQTSIIHVDDIKDILSQSHLLQTLQGKQVYNIIKTK